MLFPVALFAALVLQQQTPPAARTPAPAPASAQAPAAGPASVIVAAETTLPTVDVDAQRASPTQTCRTEAVTGSRFGRRVCRNNAQSEDDRVNSQEMLRRMQGSRMPDGG